METVTVVLSVGRDRVDEFEAGFREHELPVWRDLRGSRAADHGDAQSPGHLDHPGRRSDAVPRGLHLRDR